MKTTTHDITSARSAARRARSSSCSSDRPSPLPLYSQEQFPPLVSTTPAAHTRDASRTEPPRAPQRSSMVATGAKSDDSELNDCDKVPRRLYNLHCPTVEEASDDVHSKCLSPTISKLSLIVSNRATKVWGLLPQVRIIQIESISNHSIERVR